MKKFLISLALLLALTLTFAGCATTPTDENGNKKTTFGLNETATFKELTFTATEIVESNGTDFYEPEEGNVFIGVKFTVENISNEEQSVSSLLVFSGYCDDVKMDYSLTASISFDETLDGSIAAGKKLIGYYTMEVPADWSKIEVEVQPDLLSSQQAMFIFNRDSLNSQPQGGNEGDSTQSTPSAEAYGLNEPAILKNFKFTATEVVESNGTEYFAPEDGNVFVGVKFMVENISSESQTISSMLCYDAYYNDVKLDYSINANIVFEDSADGEVAAGKKLVGYYAVELPADWSQFEIIVHDDFLDENNASFVFNK